jgi:hypothetical protein
MGYGRRGGKGKTKFRSTEELIETQKSDQMGEQERDKLREVGQNSLLCPLKEATKEPITTAASRGWTGEPRSLWHERWRL